MCPIRLSERIRRILLWSIMAATALAVLMMSQVAHTTAEPSAEPSHAPLAAVIESVPEIEHTSAPEQDEGIGGSASGHHDNHGSLIGSVHMAVAILALGLAMLLRRTGWTVLLHQLRGLQAPRSSPTERSVPPPAPVSVLDAGCLLRV
ncbi:hypothetical protein BJF84_20690 [Rhodococcus sp. CUA-806]|nr:hypothetical protein BJF84_20690 [Rhodococcus sp. CUA-806]